MYVCRAGNIKDRLAYALAFWSFRGGWGGLFWWEAAGAAAMLLSHLLDLLDRNMKPSYGMQPSARTVQALDGPFRSNTF